VDAAATGAAGDTRFGQLLHARALTRAVTLYCDESGGISAGAMTFATMAISPADADAVVARFRAITGLRGELKGSRITPTERGLLFEILAQHDARGWVAVADQALLTRAQADGVSDQALYSRLLDASIAAFLPTTGGECADIVIDEGRYDPRILDGVRREIQAMLGQWGKASLADSRRCAGIQIADVVANSLFNLTTASVRARRIRAIVQPWIDTNRLRIIPLAA
jgi:Protein of unknown function (DUF3800)